MPDAVFLKSYADPKQVPQDGPPQVAILGRSNAGKSTLINSLAQSKNLAKASNTPGRTQLINLFGFGKEFILVDLPGYGYSKVPGAKRDSMQDLIVGYLEEAGPLAGAIVVTDSRLGVTDLDKDMLHALRNSEIPVILVANKIDKLSRSEQKARLDELAHQFQEFTIIAHSSVSGDGRGELFQAIRQKLQEFKKDPGGSK